MNYSLLLGYSAFGWNSLDKGQECFLFAWGETGKIVFLQTVHGRASESGESGHLPARTSILELSIHPASSYSSSRSNLIKFRNRGVKVKYDVCSRRMDN